jgi:acetylornithine/N-succinyldiaminopimelate aminotransferase
MAVANAVMDVVNTKEFLAQVQQTALRFKQRLAEVKDKHSSVIAEVRGEGLLMGLRMVPPAAAMVDELRAEKVLAPTAGDNVVRLLPPLIAGEAEISYAIDAIDRACTRLAQLHAPKKGAA